MNKNRNHFLNPRLIDPEYYITKLRRNDLKVLVKNYLQEGNKSIVLDFGSENAPYEPLFDGKAETFLKADFGTGHDVLITSEGFLQQPSESVDVILSLQVLEHVEDVDRYLREANRVLKPGGILWLTTHGTWPYHLFPDDFWRWTLSGLKKTISKYFYVEDTYCMLGAMGYSFMIHMHFWWAMTRKINNMQSVILNRLTCSRRWGKEGPQEKRIKNIYLYVGTLLFVLLAVPLNIIMEFIDGVMPLSVKQKHSAVFRITGLKKEGNEKSKI